MTRWTELVLSQMYPWPIGMLVTAALISFVFGAVGVWSLWRVRQLLASLPAMQERVDAVSHSLTLLTDTTESCFKALSMQLQFVQAQGGISGTAAPRARVIADESPVEAPVKGRQRRPAGAARRDDVAAIAARADLAESEVALRLHLNRQQSADTTRHGAL